MEIIYQPHVDREIESLIERIHPPRYYITVFVIFNILFITKNGSPNRFLVHLWFVL